MLGRVRHVVAMLLPLSLPTCKPAGPGGIPAAILRGCPAYVGVGDTVQTLGNVRLSALIDRFVARHMTLSWASTESGGTIQAVQKDPLTGRIVTVGLEVMPKPASTDYPTCSDGVTLITGMAANGERLNGGEIEIALENALDEDIRQSQVAKPEAPRPAPTLPRAIPAPATPSGAPATASDQQEVDEDSSFYAHRAEVAAARPIIVSDDGSTWCCLTVGDVALHFSRDGASYEFQTYDNGNVELDIEDPHGRWRGWTSFELTFIPSDQSPRSPMRPFTIEVAGKTVMTDEPSEEVTISQLLHRTFALKAPTSPKAAFGQAYDHCMATGAAGQGEQSAMQDCIGAEYSRRDDQLNLTYRAKLAALPTAQKAALRVSEREWLSALQVRCALPSDGGTDQRFEAVYCLASATKLRTEAIAALR